ncbi:hypothetical protein SDC9_134573 [bioreactor metagenome]|uniref:Uncharacterized protein n=1 Tax=bioreactor metagenome TaxID=1076179 RepID=A0A645DE06_9ZZZZ
MLLRADVRAGLIFQNTDVFVKHAEQSQQFVNILQRDCKHNPLCFLCQAALSFVDEMFPIQRAAGVFSHVLHAKLAASLTRDYNTTTHKKPRHTA